jgi:hypothetical protein
MRHLMRIMGCKPKDLAVLAVEIPGFQDFEPVFRQKQASLLPGR